MKRMSLSFQRWKKMTRGYASIKVESIPEMSAPSSQYCCESKTALKNKVYSNLSKNKYKRLE